MSGLLIKLLNLSLSAGWLILAVIILRAIFKKAPKWFPCALWTIVAIRLILPFSFESATSLIPSSEPIPSGIISMEKPQIESGFSYINQVINPVIEKAGVVPVDVKTDATADVVSADAKAGVTANAASDAAHGMTNDALHGAPRTDAPSTRSAGRSTLQGVFATASVVWICGTVILLGYALVSALRLKRKVAASVEIEEGVMACDEVKSPFVFGIFRPKIYVPSSMNAHTRSYVMAHEKAHLARRDHLWKPLGFLLLSVYWFNPLSWIAYVLFCGDIEMACDEKVVRDMEKENMAEYSQALLDCSMKRTTFAACPLAFGEIGVKQRVKNVLRYKKPGYLVVTLLLVTCFFVMGCFLTSPKKKALSETQEYGPFKYEVALTGETRFDFDGYTVELVKAAFDGIDVTLDYDIHYEKDNNVAGAFQLSAKTLKRLNGRDFGHAIELRNSMLQSDAKKSSRRVSGSLFYPAEMLELEMQDTSTGKTYTYDLKCSDEISFRVLSSKESVANDYDRKIEFVPCKSDLKVNDTLQIDRIILTETSGSILIEDIASDGVNHIEDVQKIQIAVEGEEFKNLFQVCTGQDGYSGKNNLMYFPMGDKLFYVLGFRISDNVAVQDLSEKLQNGRYGLNPDEVAVMDRPILIDTPFKPLRYDFGDYGVIVRKANFDGSEVTVDYEVVLPDGVDDFDTTQFFEATTHGSYQGEEVHDYVVCQSQLIGENEKSRIYEMKGYSIWPQDSITVSFGLDGETWGVFNLERNADMKVIVLTPDVDEEHEYELVGNAEYLIGLDFESADPEYIVDRVILTESECSVFWTYVGDKVPEDDSLKIKDILLTDPDGNDESIFLLYDKYYGYKSNVTCLNYQHPTLPSTTYGFTFLIPEGETQETMLQKFQTSKMKLKTGDKEAWVWFEN